MIFAEKDRTRCDLCGAALPAAESSCLNCLLRTGLSEVSSEANGARRFHHYELCLLEDGALHELGRGAMGVTYRALDVNLGSSVALKIISERYSRDAGARERFRREARAAAQLRHANVASVFHFGETPAGACFYAMELIEGETLDARVRRAGPLSVDHVLEIAAQVSRALVAAQVHGLIHRDLKPSNLMIVGHEASAGDDLVVKVIDFGLVRNAEATDVIHAGFSGTPEFASPEQFNPGAPLDARSDIYSLGATLCYALTGKVPFINRSPEGAISMQALEVAKVPAPVMQLLRAMLAKAPADRPQDARQLLSSIHRARAEAEAKSRHNKQRLTYASLLILLLLSAAIGLTTYKSRQQQAMTALAQKSVAVLPFENLSAEKEDAFFADGIQDDVITSLTKIRDLKVIGRASVMDYRGVTGLDKLREIGRALNVTSLLEGSVRRADDRIIVSVRLIDPHDGRQIWGETYDRADRDALSLQGELARAIADTLRVTLSPEEKARLERPPTNNPDAYALYLRGEALYRTGVVIDARQAQTHFEQAVKLDPAFALAWAKLSLTQSTLYKRRTTPMTPAEFEAAALPPAETALRLQPDLAEAHLALASFHSSNMNFERALEGNQTAVRLAPHDGNALVALAFNYSGLGREAAAQTMRERAALLNPQDGFLWKSLAISCEILRDWPAAARAWDRMILLQPDNYYARLQRAWLEISWKGDLEPARAFYRDLPPSGETSYWVVSGRFLLALYERNYVAAEQTAERAIHVLPMVNEGVQRYTIFHRGKLRLTHNAPGDAAGAREDFERALPGYQAMVDANPEDGGSLAELGEVLACLGRAGEARAAAERALTLTAGEEAEGRPTSIMIARVYARLGDADHAVPMIEQLLSVPSWMNVQELRFSPDWDPIRADPRFQAILQRGGASASSSPPG